MCPGSALEPLRAPSGRWAIVLPLREENPGDARGFIGLGYPSPIFPPPGDEALEPAAPPVLLALDRPDHGPGPMDVQLPEVAIAPLADTKQQRLATGRVLPGHQAQPRRERVPVLKCRRLSDSRHQGGRGSGANPMQLREPLTSLMALEHPLNLALGCLDTADPKPAVPPPAVVTTPVPASSSRLMSWTVWPNLVNSRAQ